MTVKIKKILFLLLLAGILFTVLYSPAGPPGGFSLASALEERYVPVLNHYISENLPFQIPLRKLSLRLGLLGGQQEQNQIFISQAGLIRNIDDFNKTSLDDNIQAVRDFAQKAGRPTYLMLLPTASAILQQQLPPYTQIGNQKQMIEYAYGQVAGSVTAVDAYPILFNKREQYIYYRTEDNLTALGGFYVHSALNGKLGLENREYPDLGNYNIEYLYHQYYGDLYQSSPYQQVRPDVLMAFHYGASPGRSYTVTHHGADPSKTYHTLYPAHLLDLGEEMQVYLGGLSAVVDIRSASSNTRSLLVFGDKTALSYLPFTANLYSRVTFVDLFRLGGGYQDLHLEEYDQVLFAYSVDNFNARVYKLELASRLLDTLPEGQSAASQRSDLSPERSDLLEEAEEETEEESPETDEA